FAARAADGDQREAGGGRGHYREGWVHHTREARERNWFEVLPQRLRDVQQPDSAKQDIVGGDGLGDRIRSTGTSQGYDFILVGGRGTLDADASGNLFVLVERNSARSARDSVAVRLNVTAWKLGELQLEQRPLGLVGDVGREMRHHDEASGAGRKCV